MHKMYLASMVLNFNQWLPLGILEGKRLEISMYFRLHALFHFHKKNLKDLEGHFDMLIRGEN